MSKRLLALIAVLLLGASFGSGGASGRPAANGLTVFAASSLTDVFPAIDRSANYSFAGSNALATQLTNGAPADVFASANTSLPAQLYAAGVVERPVNFTRNTLVIVVPKSNPANIHSVYDLGNDGVKVDVAAPSVPVGSYTLQILKQLGLTQKITTNIVSQETDVRTVLSKVALGRPLVYRALELLEERGLIEPAGSERGVRGPNRTVFRATPDGREALAAWLEEPVEHVRDVRSLLLLKLVLVDRAALDRTPLLHAQRELVLPAVRTLEQRLAESTGSEAIFVRFRLETTRAVVDFIDGLLAERSGVGAAAAPTR